LHLTRDLNGAEGTLKMIVPFSVKTESELSVAEVRARAHASSWDIKYANIQDSRFPNGMKESVRVSVIA